MTPHLTQNLGPSPTSMIGAARLVPRLPPGRAAAADQPDEPAYPTSADHPGSARSMSAAYEAHGGKERGGQLGTRLWRRARKQALARSGNPEHDGLDLHPGR